jgi:hypothetical protein
MVLYYLGVERCDRHKHWRRSTATPAPYSCTYMYCTVHWETCMHGHARMLQGMIMPLSCSKPKTQWQPCDFPPERKNRTMLACLVLKA